jgi:hypothetical protein
LPIRRPLAAPFLEKRRDVGGTYSVGDVERREPVAGQDIRIGTIERPANQLTVMAGLASLGLSHAVRRFNDGLGRMLTVMAPFRSRRRLRVRRDAASGRRDRFGR